MRKWVRQVYLAWGKGVLNKLYVDPCIDCNNDEIAGYLLDYEYETDITIQKFIEMQEEAKNELYVF